MQQVAQHVAANSPSLQPMLLKPLAKRYSAASAHTLCILPAFGVENNP